MKYIIIIIIIILVGAGYQGWNKFSHTDITPKILYTAPEALFKCKDNHDNVTYSDQKCADTIDQHLDVVIPTIDEAAAKRLKDRQLSAPDTSKTNNQVSVVQSVKSTKPSQKCRSYTAKIKSEKNKLRSGYTAAEGKSIQDSIDRYKKLYDSNCR